MHMHHVRKGRGKPLLLIHGLGGSWRSWSPILDALAETREVIAVDLPGHGDTPPLQGEASIRTFADALTAFLTDNNLLGIDAVGSSMGARLVLELARRGGVLGAVVSLDPGGFWRSWEIPVFYSSLYVSIRLVRILQPLMPWIACHAVTRTVCFAQLSARPWKLPAQLLIDEMHSYVKSPSFDELLYRLAHGEAQAGAAPGSIKPPLVIGWGRRDRVCFVRQAERASALFPDAQLHWFEHSGHFPHWDMPQQTIDLILASTGKAPSSSRNGFAAAQGLSMPSAAAVCSSARLPASSAER
ncbi:MAG: hydrolase [Rhodocyclales bacterium]|nr:hydrolase [Rhodocyclales bacterium]